jgi:thiol:disulfide interchange protein DsbD
LNKDYVIVALYVDDRTIADTADWVTTENGKLLKTIGKINFNFAYTKYQAISQPHYVIEGRNGKMLVPPRNYDLDVDGFVQFLQSGIAAYKQQSQQPKINSLDIKL